ncbi:MAG TPA: Hsp70 family protein [Terriglobia bacterium]|nr:Hsp70 family protein [Terriglobia bacterium]
MKLGIDFGTTRIVAAFVDRGNYPVVVFEAPDGNSLEWFPPLVAVKDNQRRYGWEAWAAQEEPGWTVVRSLKRGLDYAGPGTLVQIGDQEIPMWDLLHELAMALRKALLENSTLPAGGEGTLDVMLGVPANSNSNQRFLTAEAFRQAGFNVLGLLNEPSAASIEFGHHKRSSHQFSEKMRILVYDFGGGTFDASLVELDEREHVVIASEGIPTLGGDDFDEALAGLALEAGQISVIDQDSLSQAEMFRLHEECRQKKESLHPNTRRIVIDLGNVRSGWPQVTVAISDFYERCRPLVEETLHATEDLLEAQGLASGGPGANQNEEPRLEALYMTGGGSELPLIGRMLRDTFGRRVRRSTYTRAATAIGLAIQADATQGYVLRDRFTRHFGVWREAEAGHRIVFDPLFAKGTPLPGPSDPPLLNSRRYYPVHNIGHFRYLECTHLTDDGRPAGDITIWDDIRFPFDPALRDNASLDQVTVGHLTNGYRWETEESYACDRSGTVTVTIANLPEGYNRSYRLGRWATSDALVVPGRKKPRTRKEKRPSQ